MIRLHSSVYYIILRHIRQGKLLHPDPATPSKSPPRPIRHGGLSSIWQRVSPGNCCLYDFAVIASQCAGLPWQSPGYSGMYEKRTNALTNRSELLGDCHGSPAAWFAMTVLFSCAKQQFTAAIPFLYGCVSSASGLFREPAAFRFLWTIKATTSTPIPPAAAIHPQAVLP